MGTVMRWYAQDEVNQEDSEQNEVDEMKKGADSTGKVMHMWKSGWWFVMTKMEDGQVTVTTDEEWVLHVDWTEIKLCRYDIMLYVTKQIYAPEDLLCSYIRPKDPATVIVIVDGNGTVKMVHNLLEITSVQAH